MGKLSYKYTDFNIENHNIVFATDGDGVLISIPFADDTPVRIKNKLNDVINQAVDEWLENNIVVGCIPTAENLLLNARMQINYCNSKRPQYYIDVLITDLCMPFGGNLWIDGTCDVLSEAFDLREEFVTYCRNQLNNILFPD